MLILVRALYSVMSNLHKKIFQATFGQRIAFYFPAHGRKGEAEIERRKSIGNRGLEECIDSARIIVADL